MQLEQLFFPRLLVIWLILAALIFPLLCFVSAPYGRHGRAGWGPQIGRTLGWVIMESPSPLLFALLFLLGRPATNIVPLILFGLWELHYVHRTFVFPFRLRGGNPRMPLLIVLFALVFNLCNAYFNGRYLFAFAPPYPVSWFVDPRFVVGVLLFVSGLAINVQADNALLKLRRQSSETYGVPRGGLFELISCPNYLGEIVEWTGWALCTWSLPGLTFAVWTVANLLPRAISHHQWYRRSFPDYPRERRAIIPFLF